MAKKNVKRKLKKGKKINSPEKREVRASKRKIKIVFSNLLIFLFLTLISLALLKAVTAPILVNLFFMLTWVFSFIAVAFLIVFLILFLMRLFRK
jgi:hypothetical protein